MRAAIQLLLTFLLNACWQVTLIAAVASLCGWLIRGAAVRYQHWLCVAALVVSLGLPALSCTQLIRDEFRSASLPPPTAISQVVNPDSIVLNDQPAPVSANDNGAHLLINSNLAVGLIVLYLAFLFYRSARLLHAWIGTRKIKHGSQTFEFPGHTEAIIKQCQEALGLPRIRIVCSNSVAVPVTVGVFNARVILPERLLREPDADVLRSAIGHELVHVRRRDYFLNLIYEFVYLPLSFHPAAALVRRRINQTRELLCDELVAEKLLDAQAYALSLVRLIGSAAPFSRPAITVGISDADILEVRIVSLLKRTRLNMRRNVFLLVATALLLAIPCVAAASFALHLKIDSARAQEPSSEGQEKKELRARREKEMKDRAEREDAALKEKIERTTDQEIKAKLEAELVRRQEERAKWITLTSEGQTYEVRLGDEGSARAEREMEAKQKAELARQAKITMDQAIQIATSQQPGKVLECSLIGERWEAPGILGKDSLVLYRVVILSVDETNSVTYHVLVNALDGTIFRTSKGERRIGFAETSDRAPIAGGVLNSKANTLPPAQYPAIAKAAHASGAVTVEVTVDQEGNVIAARAVSGHPLLQAAAVSAAREAKFAPTRVNGEPVKVMGVLVYNFVAQ